LLERKRSLRRRRFCQGFLGWSGLHLVDSTVCGLAALKRAELNERCLPLLILTSDRGLAKLINFLKF
jgi:hypothetical protein